MIFMFEEKTSSMNEAVACDKRKFKLVDSDVGIASFMLSVMSGVLIWGTLFSTVYVSVTIPRGLPDDSDFYVLIVLSAFLGCLFCLFGVICGICGVFQKYKRKIFATIGLVSNLVTLVVITLIILLLIYS